MKQTRRNFLQQSTVVAGSGWMGTLAAIGEAAAALPTGDYKALICLFLEGGMDHANTVIPMLGDGYKNYAKQRDTLTVTVPSPNIAPLGDGIMEAAYGLNPQLPKLTSLFKQTTSPSPLAILMNVGTLEGPIVRVAKDGTGPLQAFEAAPVYKNPIPASPTYTPSKANIPVRIGSHNDQQLLWQTSTAEGAVRGWGGTMSDVLAAKMPNGSKAFSAVGIGESPALLTGEQTIGLQASVGSDLALGYTKDLTRFPVFGSSAASALVPKLLTGLGISSPSYFEQDLINIHARAIAADATLRKVPSATNKELDTFGDDADYLYAKLRNILRLIQAADITKASRRQVFFVSLGGFDTHSGQNDRLAKLHTAMDNALHAFYTDLQALGSGMQDKVTLFTASDFGRTLSSNGDGTDHGWGGHHFILGGAVKGGKIYGQPLSYLPDNVANTTRYQDKNLLTWETLQRGVPVPTTSVHQYAATLASWMGVSDADMPKVIPQIVNYPDKAETSAAAALWQRNLGFMKA